MSQANTQKYATIHRLLERIAQIPYLPTARTLILICIGLLAGISLLMIASASIPFAMNKGLGELSFFYRQLIYVIAGAGVMAVVAHMRTSLLCSYGMMLFSWAVMILMLILTLVVGADINGAKRWIGIGPLNFQPAELAKMLMVMLTAEYVVRRSADVRESIVTAYRLLIPMIPVVLLLLKQPDFGSVVVTVATMMVILFIAGAPLKQYFAVAVTASAIAIPILIMESYRFRRLLVVGDPFVDYEGDGYQQANSLMALGRGGVTGTGYGESIIKLSHLPEAHTDFLIAITGEELGLIGVVAVITLEFLLVAAMMAVSYTVYKRRQLMLAYTIFGFAVIFFGQTMINVLMNLGFGPTKGLTLPFFSYGGSSIIICSAMIGYVLNAEKNSPTIAANRESAKF